MFKFKILNMIFFIFCLWSQQLYSIELVKKKFVCREPSIVQPTAEQLFEKYKKCTKQFIESEINVKEKRSIKFVTDILADLDSNKTDYTKMLKLYLIKSILSQEYFIPEKAITMYILDFKNKKEFKINIKARHEDRVARRIEEQIKLINPSFKSESKKENDIYYLEDIFLKEFDKKFIKLEGAFNFKEIDQFLKQTLESLQKSEELKFLWLEVSRKAQAIYFNMNSFVSALNLTEAVINSELEPTLSFYLDKMRILFWQNKFKECLDFKYPKNQVLKDIHLNSSILKFKLFCEIEVGSITVKEALVRIENQSDLIQSKVNFVHLKSELLIADGQFENALNLLKKSDSIYNLFRAVDILVYQRKQSEALKLMYVITSKDKDKDIVWQTERNMKLSLIYFLNRSHIKEYEKNFKYISKICENIKDVMSKEHEEFFSSCLINRVILTSNSIDQIKHQLSQIKINKQKKLFKYKTSDQFSGLL